MFIFEYAIYTFCRGTVMARTSIGVSEDTHKMVIKTRGVFEQLFKRKLSMDDTVYLSTRLISFIYEMVQRFDALEKIEIVGEGVGSVRLEGFDNVASEIVPDVVKEFTDINDMLAEKNESVEKKKDSRLAVDIKR
jgi:hypothetical protein